MPKAGRGNVVVRVVTTGVDLDPDGYTLAIGGGAEQLIPANGSASWVGGDGTHTVVIGGLAFNCDLATGPLSLTVRSGQTTRVEIRMTCSPYLRDAIVYTSEASGAPEIAVMRPDGSRRQQLTTDGAVYAMPAVSPDGRNIAVATRLGGSWGGIYLLDRFGKGRTKLVGGGTFDGSPAWSPDGARLAFRRERPGPFGNYGRIWIIDRDGSGLRQLSPESAEYSYDDGPSWSPDGTQLVFTRNAMLMVIDADATGMRPLGIEGSYPAWSPDGRQIAFTGYVDRIQSLQVADVDGTHVRRLTSAAEGDRHARWSPDGRQLVFERIEGDLLQLWIIGADGRGAARLSARAASEFSPSWSPSF